MLTVAFADAVLVPDALADNDASAVGRVLIENVGVDPPVKDPRSAIVCVGVMGGDFVVVAIADAVAVALVVLLPVEVAVAVADFELNEEGEIVVAFRNRAPNDGDPVEDFDAVDVDDATSDGPKD